MSKYVITVLVSAIEYPLVIMLHLRWWFGFMIILTVVAPILIVYSLVIGKTPQ